MERGFNEAVTEEVRAQMGRKRLTQLALAEASGLPRTTVNRKVRGQAAWDMNDLAEIAPVLGISPSDLLRRAEATAGWCAPSDSNREPADSESEGQLTLDAWLAEVLSAEPACV